MSTLEPAATLPLPYRLLNTLGRPLLRLDLPPMALDEDTLMAQARAATGLDDFGEPTFIEPMRAFLHALRHEAQMSVLGRVALHRELRQALENRLRVTEALRQNPEIRDQPVEAPVFIVGLPRTGTTLLHNLLSQDPSARAPLAWELRYPAPPPTPETHDVDPRIALCHKQFENMYHLVPAMRAIHPMQARWPDECFYLFYPSFAELTLDALARCPSYLAYLRGIDWTPHWRYHRLQLQLLSLRFPTRRWILKAPGHIARLDAMFQVYPDARLILTHRDPADVVASCCSLFEQTRLVFSDRPDPRTMGREWLDTWGVHVNALAVARQRLPAGRCYDMHFKALMADPVGAIRHMYAALDLPFTDALERGIGRWLEENPRERHGAHRYTLERYGLTREEVRRVFEPYTTAFGIALRD